jgi:secreted trypsin-like serine protease
MKVRNWFVVVALCLALVVPRAALAQITGATPVIIAGDPNGTPPDSPTNRIDPNTTTSPWAGVGSIRITVGSNTFICTATPITPRHILTAAHCVDVNNNGTIDCAQNGVTFFLNFGGNLTHSIQSSAIVVHPNWTGFGNPNVNDDLCVITLSEDLPAGVPIYNLFTGVINAGTTFTAVGYGTTGDGVNGFISGSASFQTKRVGQNQMDQFLLDDEGSGNREIFQFDFDGPTGNGSMGGPTLGNDIETTFGGGDSGGPSFIFHDGQWKIAGVNTFIAGGTASAPLFGSLAGGMYIPTYAPWINSVASVPEPATLSLTALGMTALARRRKARAKLKAQKAEATSARTTARARLARRSRTFRLVRAERIGK